ADRAGSPRTGAPGPRGRRRRSGRAEGSEQLLRRALEAAYRAGVGTDGLELGAGLPPEPPAIEDPVGHHPREGHCLPVQAARGSPTEDPEGVPRRASAGTPHVGIAVPPAGAGIAHHVLQHLRDVKLADEVEPGLLTILALRVKAGEEDQQVPNT